MGLAHHLECRFNGGTSGSSHPSGLVLFDGIAEDMTMNRPKRKVQKRCKPRIPIGYRKVLTGVKRLIAESRHRALAAANQELVALYWRLGRVIVEQQETANWGDAVVERLAADLRAAFPDMSGLSAFNLWRTRKFFLSCRETDAWLRCGLPDDRGTDATKLATVLPELDMAADGNLPSRASCRTPAREKKPATALQETRSGRFFSALSGDLATPGFAELVLQLSWSQHTIIMGACERSEERYFYMAMSVRERWSVRELRRQIDSALFLRYVSVRSEPEKCLPDVAEQGGLLPFKDHYILEFLGLQDEHTERELRRAILANLRQFFLEFGRDLTLAGEEYPLTIEGDTFRIDLLLFHQRLQCLIAVDLKIGEFLPEHVGKSLFYVAALDEQVRLPHENPSIGLILCRSAKQVQVRLALTPAAKKIGVATLIPCSRTLPPSCDTRRSSAWKTVARRRHGFQRPSADHGLAGSCAGRMSRLAMTISRSATFPFPPSVTNIPMP